MDTGPNPKETIRLLNETVEREASFRLASAREFLGLQKLLHELDEKIAARDTIIHQQNVAAADRETAIQRLRAAVAEVRQGFGETRLDAESLAWKLLEAEEARERLEEELVWLRQTRGPFGFLRRRRNSTSPPARAHLPIGGSPARKRGVPLLAQGATADFLYHLHTCPYRIYREEEFTLRGWIVPRDARKIDAVRARVDGAEHPGRLGLEEPGIAATHVPSPANPKPGFEIEIRPPPGRHWLSLDAHLENGEWIRASAFHPQ